MSAYFVLQIEWTSDEARQAYIQGLSDMVEKNGGRFIISSTDFQVVEGKWRPGRMVVIEFPTKQSLSNWYESAEYRALRELRIKNSRSDAVVVEGL
jgi:uncharacterized protein (DUF1330 family)